MSWPRGPERGRGGAEENVRVRNPGSHADWHAHGNEAGARGGGGGEGEGIAARQDHPSADGGVEGAPGDGADRGGAHRHREADRQPEELVSLLGGGGVENGGDEEEGEEDLREGSLPAHTTPPASHHWSAEVATEPP